MLRTETALILVLALASAAPSAPERAVPVPAHELQMSSAEHGGTHMFAQYESHPYSPATPEGRRRLASGDYRPLRIVTYIVDSANSGVSAENLEYLRQSLLPAAVRYWGNALSVVPVVGPLTATRSCTSRYTQSGKCASFSANEKCSDLVSIPAAHLAAATKWAREWQGWSSTTVAGGAGVPDADFVLYATAADTAMCVTWLGESKGTFAYASPTCQRDQYDRPTFGTANWCPGKLDRTAAAWEDQLAIAIHEVGHALGMGSMHWPYMRDASNGGTPRTARAANGRPATVYGDCPDGIKRWRLDVSASTVTLGPLTPGATGAPLTASHTVSRLVTPKVRAEVRRHFGCDALAGAEIENRHFVNTIVGNICSGPDETCSSRGASEAHCTGQAGCAWITSACLGSHWCPRLFKNNVMSTRPYKNTLSQFTPRVLLALMEDTGWYVANYDYATESSWGYKAGCDFVHKPCLSQGTRGESSWSPVTAASPQPVEARHFCNDASRNACTVNRLAQGYCTLRDNSAGILPEYRYFTDAPSWGGLMAYDHCPIIIE